MHGSVGKKFFWLLPWLIWFVAASFYSHQYFSRVSVPAYAVFWRSEFSLSYLQISYLSAAFMYSYLCTQPLAGIIISRFNIKLVLMIAISAMLMGWVVIARAEHYMSLLLALLLMGSGGAIALVSCIYVSSLWFAKKWFALVNGLTFALGGFGALCAGLPLTLLINQQGWRFSAYILSFSCLLMAILAWLFISIPQVRFTQVINESSWRNIVSNFKQTLCSWRLWGPCLYSTFLFLPMGVFANLWLEPFLSAEYLQSTPAIELTASIEFAGYIVGAPIIGYLYGLYPNKHLLSMFGIIVLLLLLLILYAHQLPIPTLAVIIFFFGFFSSSALLSSAIIRNAPPAPDIAIAFGVSSLFINLAATLFLPIIAWLLQLNQYCAAPPLATNVTFSFSNYQLAFAFLPVSVLIALLCGFYIDFGARRYR